MQILIIIIIRQLVVDISYATSQTDLVSLISVKLRDNEITRRGRLHTRLINFMDKNRNGANKHRN